MSAKGKTPNELAQWAASFLAMQASDNPGNNTNSAPNNYAALTPAAQALLRSVDDGGVPTFMTTALRQIATENHIEVHTNTTPNDIVSALRARCASHTNHLEL
jgi:alpha-D-ribose 1-methylphosphonate 5-triphosphate synthase subunit PhnH